MINSEHKVLNWLVMLPGWT